MRKLSPEAKLLMLYFLTCQHRNIIGFYLLPLEYAQTDTKLLGEGFAEGFTELLDKGSVLYDEENQIILVKNYLEYNPIENPNQEKAAVKKLDELPDTPLMEPFLQVLQGLERVTPTLTQRVTQRVTVGVTVTSNQYSVSSKQYPVESKEEEASPQEVELLQIFTPSKDDPRTLDLKQLRELMEDFPDRDYRGEFRTAREWLNTPKGKMRKSVYLTLRTWLKRADPKPKGTDTWLDTNKEALDAWAQ